MLESFNANNKFDYQKLTPEEQAQRGILGRLVGVIADFKNPTRNGRLYTESLWEKTFNNPIMKEKIENKCLFGELGHPADRQEVDMEKIAICLAETPKKSKDGTLHGVFDILATPCGKILKTLCDYGCNIGVSSRGSGDTFEDYNGQETVDEDTFECECWDAVLLPAVKNARPKYVTESLDTIKTLKQALQESLDNANVNDKKVMKEALDNLNIEYTDSSENQDEEVEETLEKEQVADDDGTALVESLQEALKGNKDLQGKVINLQEQLSVSYTKELKNGEEIARLKKAVKTLTEAASKHESLKIQAGTMKTQLNDLSIKCQKQAQLVESLQDKVESEKAINTSLNEAIESKDSTITSLKRTNGNLNESIRTLKREHSKEVEKLTEEISTLRKESEIKNSQYSKKLGQSNKLIESYKGIAKKAIDKYIECKATAIGVTTNEIKNRLSENYSFDEIDEICDQLRGYRKNLSKLPFNLSTLNESKMIIKEDTSKKRFTNPDDEVDKSLFNII